MKSIGVALALLALSLPLPAAAEGALAIDALHGTQWGYSIDQYDQWAADERAVSECGPNCSVVVRFSGGCAAYAVDPRRGSTVFGWGTARYKDGAQERALDECEARANGGRCMIRVWACESR